MRRCNACDVDYPDDQFYCIQCGLPTDDCSEDISAFGGIKYVEVHNIKKSTLAFLGIEIFVFVSLGIILFAFFEPRFWNFLFLLGMLYYAFEQIRKVLNGKLASNLVNRNLLTNILLSVWIVVFIAFFITFSYYGGTPAGDAQLANYEAYEIGHYYLFNKGTFTEVNYDVYNLVGILEQVFHIFIIVFLGSLIASSIDSFVKKNILPADIARND